MSARPMIDTIVSASRAVSPPIVGTQVPVQTELSRLMGRSVPWGAGGSPPIDPPMVVMCSPPHSTGTAPALIASPMASATRSTVLGAFGGTTATSPMSATPSSSKISRSYSPWYDRVWLDQSRTARGPSWAPGRAMVVESNGMPRKAALTPAPRRAAASGSTCGAPMNVAIPPTRTECHPWRGCCAAAGGMPSVSFLSLGRGLGEHLVHRDAALLAREPGDSVDHRGGRDDERHHPAKRRPPQVEPLHRVVPEPVLAEEQAGRRDGAQDRDVGDAEGRPVPRRRLPQLPAPVREDRRCDRAEDEREDPGEDPVQGVEDLIDVQIEADLRQHPDEDDCVHRRVIALVHLGELPREESVERPGQDRSRRGQEVDRQPDVGPEDERHAQDQDQPALVPYHRGDDLVVCRQVADAEHAGDVLRERIAEPAQKRRADGVD